MKAKIQIFAIDLEDRLLEIIRTATPSSAKSYQLFKRSQQEGILGFQYSDFCRVLYSYYQTPIRKRNQPLLERRLKGGVPYYYFMEFILNYSNANLDNTRLYELKSWCCEQTQYFTELPASMRTYSVIEKSIDHLIKMAALNRSTMLEWADFLSSWEKITSREYGDKFLEAFRLLNEIKIDGTLSTLEKGDYDKGSLRSSTVSLTQTEIFWIKDLDSQLNENADLKPYPHSKGPPNKDIRKLHYLVLSANISQEIESSFYKIQIRENLDRLIKIAVPTAA